MSHRFNHRITNGPDTSTVLIVSTLSSDGKIESNEMLAPLGAATEESALIHAEEILWKKMYPLLTTSPENSEIKN